MDVTMDFSDSDGSMWDPNETNPPPAWGARRRIPRVQVCVIWPQLVRPDDKWGFACERFAVRADRYGRYELFSTTSHPRTTAIPILGLGLSQSEFEAAIGNYSTFRDDQDIPKGCLDRVLTRVPQHFADPSPGTCHRWAPHPGLSTGTDWMSGSLLGHVGRIRTG